MGATDRLTALAAYINQVVAVLVHPSHLQLQAIIPASAGRQHLRGEMSDGCIILSRSGPVVGCCGVGEGDGVRELPSPAPNGTFSDVNASLIDVSLTLNDVNCDFQMRQCDSQ